MRARALLALGIAAGAGAATIAGVRRAGRPLPEVPLPGHLVELDGEQIHYLDEGEGEAIVFVHGFAGSSFTWRHAIEALRETHRTVAIDLPGFGFGDRGAHLDYSLEAHARRVVRLLDELGIARATVVGHSLGGAVAQRLAITFPERVERLVLLSAVDASERAPWHDRRRLNTAILPLVELGLRFPALVGLASRRIVSDIVEDRSYATSEVIEGYIRPVLVPGTARAVAAMVRQTREEPAAELAVIAAPTLVISGEHDPAVPVGVGEGLAHKIRGARHVVIPATGHLAAEERPEAFLEELLAFMRETAVASGEPSAASG